MIIDFKKASYTELWELLRDVTKILDDKEPDNTSVIYVSWVKVFNTISPGITARSGTSKRRSWPPTWASIPRTTAARSASSSRR